MPFILLSRRDIHNNLVWLPFYMLFQKETLSSSVESIVSQYIVNGVLSNSYLLVFLDKINAIFNFNNWTSKLFDNTRHNGLQHIDTKLYVSFFQLPFMWEARLRESRGTFCCIPSSPLCKWDTLLKSVFWETNESVERDTSSRRLFLSLGKCKVGRLSCPVEEPLALWIWVETLISS